MPPPIPRADMEAHVIISKKERASLSMKNRVKWLKITLNAKMAIRASIVKVGVVVICIRSTHLLSYQTGEGVKIFVVRKYR